MPRTSTKQSLRITLQTMQLLDALLSDPPGGTDWYMLNLCRRTQLGSGTVNRILTRLVAGGWLAWYWEDEYTAHCQGHPRRRFYRFTDLGEQRAKESIRRKLPAMWAWRTEFK
ncbi:MAG: PadR family transcriptional regulator [Chloroflexi bacterium]|nr:MAG: PadR family transcriptional regulator [Chloroflexota bacterium]